MKINAQISIRFEYQYDNYNYSGMFIEVYDKDSSTNFLKIRLDKDQTLQAMSRLDNTNCTEAEVFGLDRIGKTMEHKRFEFPMPEKDPYNKSIASKIVYDYCPEGWKPDIYFGSRDSFFSTKDNKPYASTTIRRWVDKKDN